MKTRAAVLWERGQPLSVEEVELAPTGPGEVLVEMKAAGVVREVGSGVTRVKPGDHVVLCWAPACGACPFCLEGRAVLCDRLERTTYRNKMPAGGTRLRARDQDIAHFLSTACFAEHAVVADEGVVPVSDDVPFDALATVGCAVVTGVGAVTAVRPPRGSSVAIIGAGGVGLNVAQGAAIAGCERIIAIDRQSAPLQIARSFGATDTIEAPPDIGDAVREVTAGRGADFVFDTVGTPHTLTEALAAARKGGTVVLTGLSRVDAVGPVPMFPFVMQEKRLIGSAYGSGRPPDDIRRLVDWFKDGRLKLRELVNRTYELNQVNEALSALAAGQGARGVILL
jgi:S-(hydroxymethyl)glutathione dehydrogenase/alcohol dehydrogenase